MENLNNSRVWSLPFSPFLTISTNSGGKYSNSAVVFHFFFLSSSNIQTRIIFRVVLPKLQCVKLLRQKTNTLTPKLSILYLTEFCSLLVVCLSAPFIYIGYNLFTNSTSGNRKNAKLLKDKQFELRKVTVKCQNKCCPVDWFRSNRAKSSWIRLPVAVHVSKMSVLKLPV